MRVVPRREREPESGQLEVTLSDGGTASLPADAMQAITAALMPALAEHGTVSLTFGTPRSPGSARREPGKALEHVTSVRFTGRLLKTIRLRAAARGDTISEWIRDAATSRIFAEDTPAAPAGYRITGWSCAHVSMTAGGAVTLVPAAGCGCEMQPIYAAA